jgi:hypothetical protein
MGCDAAASSLPRGCGSRTISTICGGVFSGAFAAGLLSGADVDGPMPALGSESGGPCGTDRPRYQSTKAACSTASTSRSHTMEASTPGGTGIPRTRRRAMPSGCLWMEGAACEASGCAGSSSISFQPGSTARRILGGGESFFAQRLQYLAVSRLSV